VPEPPGPSPVPGPPQPIFPPPPTIQSGFPSYTVPPASGYRPPSAPPPFGVGSAAAEGRPFGPSSTPTAQVSPPPGYPVTGDPSATMAVPMQRTEPTEGTVYGTGGFGQIDMTMPVSMNPVENSGSLTGHILAQGWRDEIVDRRRSNIKVIIARLVVLGLLVTVSLVFLLTAGNAFTEMIKGLFG
jgi:hypothetical protein